MFCFSPLYAPTILAQSYSPLPEYIGFGPAETSNAYTWYEPGDNTGAIGRNYIVQKVNTSYWFWNRNVHVSGFGAYGYPITSLASGGSLTIGPITPTNNLQVIGFFDGSDDFDDYAPGLSTTFGAPSGYPPLSSITPLTLGSSYNGVPTLVGDLWTAGFGGFSYGAYSAAISSSQGVSGPAIGWMITMPSQ